MKTKYDSEKGLFSISSSDEEEKKLLNKIRRKLKPKNILKYNGRSGANCNDPLDKRMVIHFIFENQEVSIKATADSDEDPIRWIRDALFFGSGSLKLIKCEKKDGVLWVSFCVAFCKHCDKPMIDMGRVEHGTCDDCAKKCEHTYIEGFVHGGRAGQIGVGQFCSKCGMGKPEEMPGVLIDHDHMGAGLIVDPLNVIAFSLERP